MEIQRQDKIYWRMNKNKIIENLGRNKFEEKKEMKGILKKYQDSRNTRRIKS